MASHRQMHGRTALLLELLITAKNLGLTHKAYNGRVSKIFNWYPNLTLKNECSVDCIGPFLQMMIQFGFKF